MHGRINRHPPLEVAAQKTLEGRAVAGFVLGHLMHGVMDSVKVLGFRALGKIELTGACALFGLSAHLKIALGRVGHTFPKELGELRGVVGFFIRDALIRLGDFGKTLPVGDPAHGQVHTHLGAFTGKVSHQVFFDVFRYTLRLADNMLAGKTARSLFLKLIRRHMARRARFRRLIAGMNVTANGTNPFLHINPPQNDLSFLRMQAASRPANNNIKFVNRYDFLHDFKKFFLHSGRFPHIIAFREGFMEIQKSLAGRAAVRRDTYLKRSWMLYAMLLVPMAFFLVFRYVPMVNIVIGFKDYNLFAGVWKSPWVGFKWFVQAFTDPAFLLALRNTVLLNVLDLLCGFPAPVILAILLNELSYQGYKKTTQTIIYLPHFLSWIIISGIASQLFAPQGGVVNLALAKLGIGPIDFLMKNGLWAGTYIALGIWKEMGWGTIIYLAAITGINPEIYEAAEVDGANRWGKIWHVTLPGLRPTIIVLLIMNLGRILGSEFDRPYTMQNPLVMQVGDVISTMVYRVGIRSFQFSYTAAIGLFQSVVCVLFLVAANSLAKKTGERGVW